MGFGGGDYCNGCKQGSKKLQGLHIFCNIGVWRKLGTETYNGNATNISLVSTSKIIQHKPGNPNLWTIWRRACKTVILLVPPS